MISAVVPSRAVSLLGNLNRAFVGRMLDTLNLDPDDSDLIRRESKVITEDVRDVHYLRIILTLSRVVKRRSGTFSLTANGRRLLDEENAGELYAHLFRTFFRTFNLAYMDGMPENGTLQYGIPVVLFRLGTEAKRWANVYRLPERVLHEHALNPPEWSFGQNPFPLAILPAHPSSALMVRVGGDPRRGRLVE